MSRGPIFIGLHKFFHNPIIISIIVNIYIIVWIFAIIQNLVIGICILSIIILFMLSLLSYYSALLFLLIIFHKFLCCLNGLQFSTYCVFTDIWWSLSFNKNYLLNSSDINSVYFLRYCIHFDEDIISMILELSVTRISAIKFGSVRENISLSWSLYIKYSFKV